MAADAYGYDHQAQRRAWDRALELNGAIACRRCGQPVHCDRRAHLNWDQQKFDLGHGVPVVHGGTGNDSQPEHATCNRRAGARLGNARRRTPHSRSW